MIKKDYDEILLCEQYKNFREFIEKRKMLIDSGVNIRLPCFPEDISENIIKFILHKNGDKTSRWNCKNGDLLSFKYGKQECKCFTTNGPISFTPKTNWDEIYFLDARKWYTENRFILYKFPYSRTSNEWKNIKINKMQTFNDQVRYGRRPRICWNILYPQIKFLCKIVFDGVFNEIFIK